MGELVPVGVEMLGSILSRFIASRDMLRAAEPSVDYSAGDPGPEEPNDSDSRL
jgi:hypothetical protein